jgi:hypothetical protein
MAWPQHWLNGWGAASPPPDPDPEPEPAIGPVVITGRTTHRGRVTGSHTPSTSVRGWTTYRGRVRGWTEPADG